MICQPCSIELRAAVQAHLVGQLRHLDISWSSAVNAAARAPWHRCVDLLVDIWCPRHWCNGAERCARLLIDAISVTCEQHLQSKWH